MNTKSRLKNISDMENRFNKLESSLKQFEDSFLKWKNLIPEFEKLMKYYESEQWKMDYDDVNIWKIKPKWPHWILSEDAIYNLFSSQKQLYMDLIDFANKINF